MRFIKNFNTLATPLTKIVNKYVAIKCSKEKEHAFNLLKDKLILALLLSLSNFTKSFEIECDASKIGMRAVLIQGKTLITYLKTYNL